MIKATADTFSSGIPFWELTKDDRRLGFAVPTLFTRRNSAITHDPDIYTPGRMAVFVASGVHPAEFTDTAVFDTAVPINSDHTFPFGGDAITVYESNDLPIGVVNGAIVRLKAADLVDVAIRRCHGMGD